MFNIKMWKFEFWFEISQSSNQVWQKALLSNQIPDRSSVSGALEEEKFVNKSTEKSERYINIVKTFQPRGSTIIIVIERQVKTML